MNSKTVTKSGIAEALSTDTELKKKKWRPDCSTTNIAAIHPFLKPAEYKTCMEEAKQGSCVKNTGSSAVEHQGSRASTALVIMADAISLHAASMRASKIDSSVGVWSSVL